VLLVWADEHADGRNGNSGIEYRLFQQWQRATELPAGSARAKRPGWRGRVWTWIRDADEGLFPGFGHNLFGAPYWPEIDNWLSKILPE